MIGSASSPVVTPSLRGESSNTSTEGCRLGPTNWQLASLFTTTPCLRRPRSFRVSPCFPYRPKTGRFEYSSPQQINWRPVVNRPQRARLATRRFPFVMQAVNRPGRSQASECLSEQQVVRPATSQRENKFVQQSVAKQCRPMVPAHRADLEWKWCVEGGKRMDRRRSRLLRNNSLKGWRDLARKRAWTKRIVEGSSPSPLGKAQ